MHEASLVKKAERVESWSQHLLHFGWCQRALGQNFRENFAGVFRYDVKNFSIFNAIAAGVKGANEVRMKEPRGCSPIGFA